MENLLKNVYTHVSIPVPSCSFEPTWNRLLSPFLHFKTHCVFYSHCHSHSLCDLDLQAFLYTCLASSSSVCMKCLSPNPCHLLQLRAPLQRLSGTKMEFLSHFSIFHWNATLRLVRVCPLLKVLLFISSS